LKGGALYKNDGTTKSANKGNIAKAGRCDKTHNSEQGF
jgi:hypothetical protein